MHLEYRDLKTQFILPEITKDQELKFDSIKDKQIREQILS